ncbi:acetylglutamate kinase [Fimbriiglobus ruber]|uniref:Acetylglutamate kinase n=1 Tax=Fimbriiglobus ruber TaxID=1908690 RepID=A0A225DGW0_9BACT|nr:acetylglutamate kinase [Fimbriiglobus ruber]OWK36616.1 Acetylglutamate kinase [Fimbriiglobus ruber]
MNTHPSPPETLVRAATRARALRGRTVVVKLGGSAMEEPAALRGTLESVVALQTLGVRLVLVHGGGKPIDRAMAAAGLSPRKVQGRRYTDDATLEVVVRVLRDEINAEVVKALRDLGGRAAGLHTGPAQPLFGRKLLLPGTDGGPIDLGRVGTVTRTDTSLLTEYLDAGFIPVVPSLAISDEDGGWLNVNADTAAGAAGGSLRADSVAFLTDTPGVLRDVSDPDSLFARLTRTDCRRLIAEGVIAGGMLPKIEACFDALDAGAGRTQILDGRQPHALLGEFVSDHPTGTEIVN